MNNANSTLRFCPKCGTETARNTRGECKKCKSIAAAAWRAKNPEKLKAASAAYRAANYAKVRAGNAAWQAANHEKVRAIAAAYRVERREKVRATSAAYYAENKEKASRANAAWRAKNPGVRRIYVQNYRAKKRTNGGALSKGISAKLFTLQQGMCPCCHQPLGADYHLDHIMPLVLGGTNTNDNMQLLRARCNLQKNKKHPIDFMQERGFLL